MSGIVMSIVQFLVVIPAMIGYIRGKTERPYPRRRSRCLARLAAGDEDARDELIEHNMRLVAHIVKFHQNTNS